MVARTALAFAVAVVAGVVGVADAMAGLGDWGNLVTGLPINLPQNTSQIPGLDCASNAPAFSAAVASADNVCLR